VGNSDCNRASRFQVRWVSAAKATIESPNRQCSAVPTVVVLVAAPVDCASSPTSNSNKNHQLPDRSVTA